MQPRPVPEYQHFTKLYQEELARVVRDAKLTHAELELLMYLIAQTTYKNVVSPRTIGKIAEALARDRTTIGRALARLDKRNLVRRSASTNSGHEEFVVTPWLVFMGYPAQRAAAIKAWSSNEKGLWRQSADAGPSGG